MRIRIARRSLERARIRRERFLLAAAMTVALFVWNETRDLLDAPTDVYSDAILFEWRRTWTK